jgi:hypothetical protein
MATRGVAGASNRSGRAKNGSLRQACSEAAA